MRRHFALIAFFVTWTTAPVPAQIDIAPPGTRQRQLSPAPPAKAPKQIAPPKKAPEQTASPEVAANKISGDGQCDGKGWIEAVLAAKPKKSDFETQKEFEGRWEQASRAALPIDVDRDIFC